MTDTRMEDLEGSLTSGGLPQVRELFFLTLADDRKMAHFCPRLCHHAFCHCHDTLRQSVGQSGRIERVVILDHNTSWLYLDSYFEFRNVQFKRFLSNGLTINHIL